MSDDKKQQVLALGRLGWTLRDIEEAVEVRRETASRYLKAAGIPVRAPRAPTATATAGRCDRGVHRVGRRGCFKPASPEWVSTDSAAENGVKPVSPAIGTSTDPAAKGGANPASRGTEVSTDSESAAIPSRAPAASACEPYRDLIEAAVRVGRNAKAIVRARAASPSRLRAADQAFTHRCRKDTVAVTRQPLAANNCSIKMPVSTPPIRL